MVSYRKDHGDTLDLEDFNTLVKVHFLNGTIKQLRQFPEVTAAHISALERAKDARNYIAHESAIFFETSARYLVIARLKRLREQVSHLAHGSNLVHSWSYEIGHRRPPPRDIFPQYPKIIDQWVF